MIKNFRILVICICLFNPFYSVFSSVEAAPPFLADKHKVAGISCEGCHKENPPKEQVATLVCNKCHGDQVKLAERTQKVIPNPHDSHLGNVECGLCHHGHKPSEDYCSTCHDFGYYKVP
jgi:fumarate reductase flavoprotein subunit